jgi:hypothetical protein
VVRWKLRLALVLFARRGTCVGRGRAFAACFRSHATAGHGERARACLVLRAEAKSGAGARARRRRGATRAGRSARELVAGRRRRAARLGRLRRHTPFFSPPLGSDPVWPHVPVAVPVGRFYFAGRIRTADEVPPRRRRIVAISFPFGSRRALPFFTAKNLSAPGIRFFPSRS